MVPADIALALLINRCANASIAEMPPYMTFEEHTHITGNYGPFGINKNINRGVTVRTADAYAVMQDLPKGSKNTGSAFPVPPAFDPFSSFQYSYFVNFGRLDIDYYPAQPYVFNVPAPDPSVAVEIAYFPYWAPHYAPDSTDQAPHILIDQTTYNHDYHYVSDVTVDPTTQLPSQITLQVPQKNGLITVHLDYAMVENHWVVTHGSMDSVMRVGLAAKGHAETTFTNFVFSATPPDAELDGTLRPSPTPAP